MNKKRAGFKAMQACDKRVTDHLGWMDGSFG